MSRQHDYQHTYSPKSRSMFVLKQYDPVSNFQIGLNKQKQKNKFTNVDEQTVRPTPVHFINGVDCFQDHMSLNKMVEAIDDVYSVKGHYLYLNKGKKVCVTSVIGEFCQIYYNGKIAYFPSNMFKFV